MSVATVDERWRTDEKQQYRESVWAAIVACMHDHGIRPPSAHVLILPADSGKEISILKEHGFQEKHIHAVDKNAAMLATLKKDPESWRNKYPAVNIYGNRLPRACERIRESGVKLHATNFDLCGNLGDPVYNDVKDALATGVLARQAAVALTMLKGRETATTLALLNGRSRVEFVLEAATRRQPQKHRRSLSIVSSGQYRNGPSPMVWAVAYTRDYGAGSFDHKIDLCDESLGKIADLWSAARTSPYFGRWLDLAAREYRLTSEQIDEFYDLSDALGFSAFEAAGPGWPRWHCSACSGQSSEAVAVVSWKYWMRDKVVAQSTLYCSDHVEAFLDKNPTAEIVA